MSDKNSLVGKIAHFGMFFLLFFCINIESAKAAYVVKIGDYDPGFGYLLPCKSKDDAGIGMWGSYPRSASLPAISSFCLKIDSISEKEVVTETGTVSEIDEVTINKGYCSDIDKNGKLAYGNGNIGELNNPTCYLKSCKDLTIDELDRIYEVNKNAPVNADGNKKYFKFCEPYEYIEDSSIKFLKIKTDVDLITLDSSVLPYYCFDENRGEIGRKRIDYLAPFFPLEDGYNNGQCMLHDCPYRFGDSLVINSNFYKLMDLNDEDKNNYSKFLFEDKIYSVANEEGLYFSSLCNTISDSSKTTVQVVKEIVNEADFNDCDEFDGLDINFKESNPEEYNRIKNGIEENLSFSKSSRLEIDTTTDPKTPGICIKTYDCLAFCQGMINKFISPSSSESYKKLCVVSSTVEECGVPVVQEEDEEDVKTISYYDKAAYFYRPQPMKGLTREGRLKPELAAFFYKNPNKTGRLYYFTDKKDFFKYGSAYGDDSHIGSVLFSGKFSRPNSTPHTLPKDGDGLGLQGSGRQYLCKNHSRSIFMPTPVSLATPCVQPQWDVAYIAGYDYTWSDKRADIDHINVLACVRFQNTKEVNSCGLRQCRVDCAFGLCPVQYCGTDRCVLLTTSTSPEDAQKSRSVSDFGLSKVITNELFGPSVRTRAIIAGRKLCVFLDSSSGTCLGAKEHKIAKQDVLQKDSVDHSKFTNFVGVLDSRSIFDDNSLRKNTTTDPDYITDNDVFGVSLYRTWQCSSTDPQVRNPKCDEFKIGLSNDEPVENGWFTWGIIPFAENNQPVGSRNPNCRIGSPNIDKCRGFYDFDGNFIPEQQCITLPLTVSPEAYFKYATPLNMPDLFFPLLVLDSFYTPSNTNSYSITTTAEEYIVADFFEPWVHLSYGESGALVKLGFADLEKCKCSSAEISAITDKCIGKNNCVQEDLDRCCLIKAVHNGENLMVGYNVVKGSSASPITTPNVCARQQLTQVDTVVENGREKAVTKYIESDIRCLRRDYPNNDNVILFPYRTNNKTPTIKAYFSKNYASSLPESLNIQNLDKDRANFASFTMEKNGLGGSELSLSETGLGYAYSQNYGVTMEKTFCSRLNYECITYQKDYMELQLAANTESDRERLADLGYRIEQCSNYIASMCAAMDGNKAIVNLDKNQVRIKKDYNADGAHNQICITKGFETKTGYVKTYPTTIKETFAKCELEDESKMLPECRLNGSAYLPCTANRQDNTCVCYNNGQDCYREIVCNQCVGDECKKLDPACYLSGVNGTESVFSIDKNGGTNIAKTISCKCRHVNKNSNEQYTRAESPREAGLCVDLADVNFCEQIKYCNSSEECAYDLGGVGRNLDDVKKSFGRNIWRTSQEMGGKYFSYDYGQAEFNRSTFCEDDSPELCALKEVCYNKNDKKIIAKADCKSGECECKKLATGECRGFWKAKDGLIPLASCVVDESKGLDSFNGRFFKFDLLKGTECERYSCSAINAENLVTEYEKNATIFNAAVKLENGYYTASGNQLKSVDLRGKSNGFGFWKRYKKGSDLTAFREGEHVEIREGYTENGHGDDLEERYAYACTQGFGPAGTNYNLRKFMPVIEANIVGEYVAKSNRWVDNVLNNSVHSLDSTSAGYSQRISDFNIMINNLKLVWGYNPINNFPARNCNQMGDWTGVRDVYNYYKQPLYHIDEKLWHDFSGQIVLTDDCDANGKCSKVTGIPSKFLDNSVIPEKDRQYKHKYCERLFCPSFGSADVNLLSTEKSAGSSGSNYNLNSANMQEFFGNGEINAKTTWRHTGGALWNETPAPRFDESDTVKGRCDITKNFYTFDTVFLESFDEQHRVIFGGSITDYLGKQLETKNMKELRLNKVNSGETQPSRECTKWGVWSPITNKCAAACEALSTFRSEFTPTNAAGYVKNSEITKMYNIPVYRDATVADPNNNRIRYGDAYTGGAVWARTLGSDAGVLVTGVCDTSIGKNSGIRGASPDGEQFIAIEKLPTRSCNADGTWGPVANPCVRFYSCNDKNVNMLDLNSISSSNIVTNENAARLTTGSIVISGLEPTVEEHRVDIPCDDRYFKPGGLVSQSCNIITGEWSGNHSHTCVLRTCPGLLKDCAANDENCISRKVNVLSNGLGDNLASDIPANTYYSKHTGLIGGFVLGATNYIGYETEISCAPGFAFQEVIGYDTDGNEQYGATAYGLNPKYTCDNYEVNGSSKIGWRRTGRCVPVICNIDELKSLVNTSDRIFGDRDNQRLELWRPQTNLTSDSQWYKPELRNLELAGKAFTKTTAELVDYPISYNSEGFSTNFPQSTGNIFVSAGTHVNLGCKANFVESELPVAGNHSIGYNLGRFLSYAYCNFNGGWVLTGSCGGGRCTDFFYTGSPQTFNLNLEGEATLDISLYGAQGGGFGGGKGGFTEATIMRWNMQTPLQVYIGGQGFNNGTDETGGFGGWNGGGNGGQYCGINGNSGSGGGGGSDIRTGLAVSTRILVAGGGGGSSEDNKYFGGSGGGINGNQGFSSNDSIYAGRGGTQTAGGGVRNIALANPGTLFYGANAMSGISNDDYCGGGGGGGYFGGSSGEYGKKNYNAGGGGGSGFVNTNYRANGVNISGTTYQNLNSGDGSARICYTMTTCKNSELEVENADFPTTDGVSRAGTSAVAICKSGYYSSTGSGVRVDCVALSEGADWQYDEKACYKCLPTTRNIRKVEQATWGISGIAEPCHVEIDLTTQVSLPGSLQVGEIVKVSPQRIASCAGTNNVTPINPNRCSSTGVGICNFLKREFVLRHDSSTFECTDSGWRQMLERDEYSLD